MKKRITIILLLIVTFILISFIFSIIKKTELFIGGTTKITINNNNIKIGENKKSFSPRKAKILFNNGFIDGYISSEYIEDGSTYVLKLYDKSFNQIVLSSSIFAYTGNIKITIPKYETTNYYTKIEKDYINGILNENNLSGPIDKYTKILVDIDKDNNYEELYSISTSNETNINSIVFIKNDDNYEIIDSKKGELAKAPSIESVDFSNIIDINDDGIYEIVLINSFGDDSPSEYNIYTYKNGEIEKVGDK